ncbi:MAG: amino acid permease [Candidatus Pacearchaeota archaeon]|jgi:amino acid transporter
MALKQGFKLSLAAFVLLTCAALVSIRTFPTQGVVGWELIAFSILAIIMYLIPASFVSAELTTGWPKEGGVYVWVKEAFGQKWGFTAVWLQWFQMTIGFISVLTFIAATLAYLFNPSFAENKLFQFLIIVVIWWGFTFLNFRGMKTYSKISSYSVIIGTFIPAAVLIIGGLIYIFSGNPVQLSLSPSFSDFIPDFSSLQNLVLLITFIFVFIGIEMTATHAREIKNVQRNYPLGILIVGIITVTIGILGSLIVSMIVPLQNLNLLGGIMQTFQLIFQGSGLGWLVKVFAFLIVVGAVGQVSTWILGPVRGLSVTAEEGLLPKILQKKNKNGIPTNLLILQAIFITFWGLVYVLLPGGVNSSFWILFALTTAVYIIMYLLMYAAAIKLRYSHPEVKRSFSIPGGKVGMWIVSGFGFISMIFLFVLAILPPSQIAEKTGFYTIFMLIGTIVVVAIPLIIYHFKKKNIKLNKK